jgi:endonuclease YncB( thermonuclease family)
MAKLILKVPTTDAQAGDVIEVSDKDLAEELVANGSARRATAAAKKAESASS